MRAVLTRGKLITLLHSRAQGGLIGETLMREMCRQAEQMLRRDSATPMTLPEAEAAERVAFQAWLAALRRAGEARLAVMCGRRG